MQGVPEKLTPEMLRRFRHHLNCTQAEIAALLGITMMTWGRWERGEEQPAHAPMLLYALEYLAIQLSRVKTLQQLHHSTATSLATDYWNERTAGRKRIRHVRDAVREYEELETNPIV